MADPTAPTPADSVKQAEAPPGGAYARWHTEVQLAEKETDRWRKRVNSVLQRYIDDRGSDAVQNQDQRAARFNVLWSFVQTNSPALYLREPKATVERRFKDADPLGRAAGEILQRATQAALLLGQAFTTAMKAAVFDYQIGGRGVAWVRYVPSFAPDNRDKIAWETAPVDYVHWTDFLHNPARTWSEVRWVARRHYFTREQCMAEFGAEIGDKITLDFKPKGFGLEDAPPKSPKHEMFAKATVWEIWDKDSRKRVWLALGYDAGLARTDDDPLALDRFFPCPRPLFGTLTTDSLVPTPDYALWQDQAGEIDRLTTRIDRITRAIKVAGAYDKAFPELARVVQDTFDGDLVPVDNWAQFAQTGGFEGSIDYLSIEQYVTALQALVEARAQAKNDLYEITGQADIIRGSSNPNETATAQRIKGQFATLRLQERQAEVQRFARDMVELVAEVIATKFQPQTIAIMAGVEIASDPEVQQMFPRAIELLRDDMLRTFRIDIETDTMIALDEQADKAAATELVEAIGVYLERALPLAQQQPALAPLLGQVLLWAVRRFRAGRDLESTIEQALRKLEQTAAQPQQPPPDPKMLAAQADAQRKDRALAGEQQLAVQAQQFDQALAVREMQGKQALAAQEQQGKAALAAQAPPAETGGLREAVAAMTQAVAALTAIADRQTALLERLAAVEQREHQAQGAM